MFIVSSFEKNKFSLVSFNQNELLNFAVWVLQQEGLQVDTFDTHGPVPRLSSYLKAFGFGAADWKAWVRKMAISQYAIDMSIEHIYPYNEDAVLYIPPVIDGLAVEDKNTYKICHDFLVEISEEIPTSPVHSSPIAFLETSVDIKEHLRILWEKFRLKTSARVHFRDDFSRLMAKDADVTAKIHEAIQPGLLGKRKAISYYFVRYPYEPAFHISGSSILLGMREPFSVDDMLLLLKQSSEAIEQYPS